MSCNRTSLKGAASAVVSGIAQAASKSASVLGAGTRQAATWANQNPEQAAYAAGALFLTGATAAYYAKRDQGQGYTENLAQSGLPATFERTGQAPTDQDRALAARVDEGLKLVQARVGQPEVDRVSLGDDFALAGRIHAIGQAEFAGSKRPLERGYARAYGRMKPLITGYHYLGQKIARTRLGVNPGIGTVSSSQVNGSYGREIALNVTSLGSRSATRLDAKMGGRYAEYVAAREGIYRVPRVYQPRGTFRLIREDATLDAVARRVVAPDFKGRTRSDYEFMARVADWNARRIAHKSGEEPLAVLVRQLGVQKPDQATG